MLTTALYLAILKREPDRNGLRHYAKRLVNDGLARVVAELLASEEYLQQVTEVPVLDATRGKPMIVECRLPPEQLDLMWRHVQEVWTSFGEVDPYHSVLTEERYRAPNMTSQAVLDEFYASGMHDLKILQACLNRQHLDLSTAMSIVEYGCGVGRITHYLAPTVGSLMAMDISAPHLDAARTRMSRDGIGNVTFVHVSSSADLQKMKDLDLFFSVIVLQHNPPPIMLDILRAAFAALKPGGVAVFQIPTFSSEYRFVFDEYMRTDARERIMEMHFLPQHEIFRLAEESRMKVLEVRVNHAIGNFHQWLSNTFIMIKAAPVT